MAASGESGTKVRDHLFINYATEDARFVDWLGLKLAAEGYAIWYDRYKLLGGEKYPQSIDDAIKNRSFRMLSVLSRSSIKKDNPVAERTLGFNIGRDRKIDFIIPLNIDGLTPTELDWQTSPLNYIPFNHGWSAGLAQLLKTLDSLKAPRTLPNPRETAARAIAENDVILCGTEMLFSNFLPVKQYPLKVKCYALTTPSTESGMEPLEDLWAFYRLGNQEVLSFTEPSPTIISDYALEKKEVIPLNMETLRNVPTRNIVQNLIYKSIGVRCREKGLLPILPREGSFYFPYNDKDWLRFVDFNGEERRRLASGTRTARSALGSTQYHWHIAPRLKVLPHGRGEYNLLINIGAYVTELDGGAYSKRLRNARVKAVTSDWWNNKILEYQMAVAELLSEDGDKIVIGNRPDEQVVISGRFVTTTFSAQVNDASSVNEEAPEFYDETDEALEDEGEEDE